MEQTRGHAAQPEAIGEGEQHLDGGVLLLGLVGHFGRDRDPQLRCAWPFCGCGQVFLAISDRWIEAKTKGQLVLSFTWLRQTSRMDRANSCASRSGAVRRFEEPLGTNSGW